VGQQGWLVHNSGPCGKAIFDSIDDLDQYSTDDVLSMGQSFLGDNPVTLADGVYVSSNPISKIGNSDVFGRFRITASDIDGGHYPYEKHANFELVHKIVDNRGRTSYRTVSGQNKHIIFTDSP